MCCGVRSDARLVEQLWCQCLCERFDLAGELALLNGQLQHPACDRAEREQAAAQLRVVSATGSGCREPLHEARTGEGPQLAAQRLRRGDQEIPELAERGPLRVDGACSCSDKRLQRLSLAARTWRRGPHSREHAARRTDRVERVSLAASASLSA